MKLSEVKTALKHLKEVRFVLPDEEPVPAHFHVTEIGRTDKYFADCGGTVRTVTTINFQLFTATDYDHRLSAPKLLSIIESTEARLRLPDCEVEVEYQGGTIEKYHLQFAAGVFQLIPTQTDCLAKDACKIPSAAEVHEARPSMVLVNACVPGSGCCESLSDE